MTTLRSFSRSMVGHRLVICKLVQDIVTRNICAKNEGSMRVCSKVTNGKPIVYQPTNQLPYPPSAHLTFTLYMPAKAQEYNHTLEHFK